MKNIIISALLAASLSVLAPVPSAHATTPINVSCDTGSTTCTVVSGVSTSTITINKLLLSLSSATSETITFKCGSTTVFGPLYFASTGGVVFDVLLQRGSGNLICPPSQDFNAVKGTAATPLTVFVIKD